MFIEVHATPNVNSLKFHPGRTVLKDGTYDFPNARAVCCMARIVWLTAMLCAARPLLS